MSTASVVEADTKEATPVVEKTMTLEEQIDRLVAQFKVDLLALLSTTTTKEQEQQVVVNPNPTVDANGNKMWKNAQGQIHRVDGPAMECANGDQIWYENGLVHRDHDLPADVHANGTQIWLVNGQRHRADGKPALIRANGEQEWWVEGKCVKKLLFKTG